MKAEQINREMIEFRRQLVELAKRYAAGERTELYREARDLTDALTCLFDEAAEGKRWVVAALLERYETLLRSLAH